MKDIRSMLQESACKTVTDGAMTSTWHSELFPLVIPIFRLTTVILDIMHTWMMKDGAGDDPFGHIKGKPILAALMSPDTRRSLEAEGANKEFLYEEPTLFAAEPVRAYNVPVNPMVVYGGFACFVTEYMPRYDFINGEWQERPMKDQTWAHATCEDILLYHKHMNVCGAALRVRRRSFEIFPE